MYKIVLVDDDEGFVDRFNRLVDWDEYGLEVVQLLHDGKEALDYVADNLVDAVLTDIRMPEMDGVELASNLYNTYPYVKCVFFSTYRDFKCATQALQYEVLGYMVKPIMRDQLDETLKKLRLKLDRVRMGFR